MSEQPNETPKPIEGSTPPAETPAAVPTPKKPKRPPSRAQRFQDAAQAVIDACDSADDNLSDYVSEINGALNDLNNAIAALQGAIEAEAEAIENALVDLRDVRSEYQEQYDNLSERGQEGERGQMLSAICDINLEPDMPEVDIDVPGECDAPDFDPVRDVAQECLDAELP